MSTLQNALDIVENLDVLEKEMFFDIINKRRIEERRKEILENANQTFQAIENGSAKIGSLDELLADLED